MKLDKLMQRFVGKVVIVTGAASGIGKAIADKFHREGAMVILSDIQTEEGERTAADLGDRALFVRCDIADANQVNYLVNTVIERFGKLDVMVNNAGVNSLSPRDRVTVDRYPDETWHRMINIDLNGTFYCCKAASRVMIVQGGGAIVNVASVAGVVALRLQIGFVAAKAAIIKMSEAMACELGPMGIRTNVVSPGSTITEATKKLFSHEDSKGDSLADRILSFIPQGRAGEASEIADAVAFLASNDASYINGHNVVVDGGWISGFNRDF